MSLGVSTQKIKKNKLIELHRLYKTKALIYWGKEVVRNESTISMRKIENVVVDSVCLSLCVSVSIVYVCVCVCACVLTFVLFVRAYMNYYHVFLFLWFHMESCL